MKIMRLQILATLIIGTFLSAAIAFAEQTPTTKPKKVAEVSMSITEQQTGNSVTEIKSEETEAKRGLSLGLGVEYSQKTAVDEKAARESDLSITFIPVYQISKALSLGAKGVFTQENNGPRNTKLSNTTLTVGIEGFQLNEQFKTVHSILGVIPTSEESQKRDRYKGGVAIGSGISFNSDLVKLKYVLSLARNIHEYTFNAEGTSNIEYRVGHSLESILQLTDTLSLSALGIYRIGRTYGGFERTGFELHGDVNLDIAKGLTLNIGTSNDGDALKSNGVDSNISAYNENSAAVRAGISYAY
jgi:hypothetical protein